MPFSIYYHTGHNLKLLLVPPPLLGLFLFLLLFVYPRCSVVVLESSGAFDEFEQRFDRFLGPNRYLSSGLVSRPMADNMGRR